MFVLREGSLPNGQNDANPGHGICGSLVSGAEGAASRASFYQADTCRLGKTRQKSIA